LTKFLIYLFLSLRLKIILWKNYYSNLEHRNILQNMPAKNYFAENFLTKTLLPFPYPVQLLKIAPWDKFIEQNGYLDLSRKLNLKVYTDFSSIKNLWEEFSPCDSVFDLWEVRQAFWEGYKFDPYFISLVRGKGTREENIALLPLWFNSDPPNAGGGDDALASDGQKYVWYGSNWPEDNVFFSKNDELIPLLLVIAPKPLELACIRPKKEYSFLKEFPGVSNEEEQKYFLDISHTDTLENYLKKLKKKKRYNLKRDRKKILKLKPQTVINEKSHIEELFRLSIKRFREQFPDEPLEHSAFEDNRRKNVFRTLINNAGRYQFRLISTIIKGCVEAVEFGLVYKKTYYALNAGANISKYSGIGVYSNLLVVEDAINLGCEKIDFLEGDNNWKESWHLDHFYQYQYKKL